MDGQRWVSARRVLCVRLDTIGDVLMTTPAIRACKGHGREVTLLTSRAGAEIARLVPEIDDVIVVDAPWVKNATALPDSTSIHALTRELAARAFDAAVIFTVHSQSPLPAAMVCWLADIPLRLAHCRENPYQLLTDWVREPEHGVPSRHEVRRQLDLVGAVGWHTQDERLSLRTSAADIARAVAKLRARGIDTTQPWIVLHPGATAPSRRYPAELYAIVADLLAHDGLQVAVTGTQYEEEIVARVCAGVSGVVVCAGLFDLREMAALLSVTPLLVANNTGPAHMAAAFNTPVVDVYALTNPQHTPWMTPSRVLTHDVPCANCMSSVCREEHHACLRMIAPQEVAHAARELLETTTHDHNATATTVPRMTRGC
jgi:lipopolysaccharide heptosyltransferase II